MSETIMVRRTGQAPLRVRGVVIASNGSSMNNACSNYSGSPGVSEDVKVLKTASGKYVVSIHHSTIWEGAHDTDEAAVFPTLKEAVDFLGERVPGWMMEELVKEIGEDKVAVDVE